MRMPPAAGSNPGATTVEPSSAMSPNSEVYEPLTPKNDDNSSLCNGAGGNQNVDVGDDMDETKTKLRVRIIIIRFLTIYIYKGLQNEPFLMSKVVDYFILIHPEN